MKRLKRIIALSIGLSACLLTQDAKADSSCSDYPESRGINFVNFKSGIKVLSTAQVPVGIDDIDAVDGALEEAEMLAKRGLLQMKEGTFLNVNQKGNLTRNQNIKIDGEGKNINMDIVRGTVTKWKESTKGRLRGIAIVGDCYTKGKFVRVTVGFKDEYVDAGEKLKTSMDRKKSITEIIRQKVNSKSETDTEVKSYTRQNHNSIDGYSNSNRLSE